MQNKSRDGTEHSDTNQVDVPQSLAMPQRLSNEYLKYRLWVSFLVNVICWSLTTGLYFGIILIMGLRKYYLRPPINADEIYGQMFFLSIFYIAPMFTCIKFHKRRITRYFASYQWEIFDGILHIQEGVSTLKNTRILLSTIQSIDITQGYWERKYGWYKVTILAAGIPQDLKETVHTITARILGCREPYVVQEFIENAVRECKKKSGIVQ